MKGFKTVKNKEFRIGNLEVPAKNGKIYLHYGLLDMPDFPEFRIQWSTFPNLRNDDVIDVVEMLVSGLRKGNRTFVPMSQELLR